ncbi:MAG TPA: 2-C-methyl-D-erythritol 4-phosphate cytidylyltransferase [Burkholderiales bacterium]|nr:2-C-methyl-D-erythritol 4-phosphate cytidylyltransferase [Burkholderiales bacterium]
MAKLFALVPAAGSGTRIGGDLPKQYLMLAGRPLLHHALATLCRDPAIERVFVVLAPGDTHYARYDWQPLAARITPLYCGGETRAASVFNGLLAARDEIDGADWVLVHDAVRPCLAPEALARLIAAVRDGDSGGLLALPVVDTLKRGDDDARVVCTEAREHLWQAQTPQMFRYRLLLEALRAIDPAAATDEAYAVEQLGVRPQLVTGDARNFKITYPQDLALAELILGSMQPQMDADKR